MEETMRKIYLVATLVALTGFAATASAQNSTVTGAAIGAGAGAVVAGPPGAIVGGVIGATVGGPNIRTTRSARQTCWRDRRGVRHCRWR
jgi:outer membrane lipoprotein SlyB